MKIQVCYALPEHQEIVDLFVTPNTNIREAIEKSGILQKYPNLDLNVNDVGIYGEVRSLETVLHNGDRVEIYRPLKIDALSARQAIISKKKKKD